MVVLAWAGLLAALTAVLWIWSPGDELAIASLGGAAVAAAALGAGLAVLARRAPSEPAARVVPDLSPPTALVAIAIAAMLFGAVAGLWLVLLGAGLLAFGLGGLLRELRAERR
jgi:hypothetical protein